MHFLEMSFVGWETENWDGTGVGRSTQITLVSNWVALNEISL